MHPYVTRILDQFDPAKEKAGLELDLDALAISLHCKMASRQERGQNTLAFAFNGYEDFNAFLFLVRCLIALSPGHSLRLQFALRDQGAHYLAGDLEVRGDEAQVFIMDSSPSQESALKWARLLEAHFPKRNTVYDHPHQFQRDGTSCKVFTLDAVNHLANLPELYTHLKTHAQPYKRNLRHLPAHALPVELMRNVQSLSQLGTYLKVHPEWAQVKINKRGETLQQSVDRHTTRTRETSRNEAILHKLRTFEDKARRFTAHGQQPVLSQIVAERNGLLLLRQLEQLDPSFAYPNLCGVELVRDEEGTHSLKVPLREKMPQARSSDWEGMSTVFSVKKNSSNASKEAVTWLDLATHGVTLTRVDKGTGMFSGIMLTGALDDLLRMVEAECERIEEDPIAMLVRGCSQPLGTRMVLGAMRDLLERAGESPKAQARFLKAYVDAMCTRSTVNADEAREAGLALASRHERQLLCLTASGIDQLAREAALRSCQHALKRGTWRADVFLEGVTQARGGDVWNKKRERLQTHSSITEEWTAEGVFKRSGTKDKYAGPSTEE